MGPDKTFELRAGDLTPNELRVTRLSGSEQMSQPYSFEVEVLCLDPHLDVERAALGSSARLTIAGSRPRVFHGVVSDVELLGMSLHQQRQATLYRVHVASRLWLLDQQRGSRVFQDMSVRAIVQQVLDEARISCCWALEHTYPERALCIQYEESDLAFIHRLLAECGIFYFFEQPPWTPTLAQDVLGRAGEVAGAIGNAVGGVAGGVLGRAAGFAQGLATGEIVVFADACLFYPALGELPSSLVGHLGSQLDRIADGPVGEAVAAMREQLAGFMSQTTETSLHYRPQADALSSDAEDVVTSWTTRGSVRPLMASFRDFDPRKPRAPIAVTRRAPPEGLADNLGQLGRQLDELAGQGIDAARQAAQAAGAGDAFRAGEAALDALHGRRNLEVYDHHGTHLFPDWTFDERQGHRMLEAERREARRATGTSRCRQLAVGHRFHLAEHPIERINADYVVVGIEHRGRAYEESGAEGEPIYDNSFRCVPAHVPYVSMRPARQTVQTCLTATVVTPGADIDTADYAMIKVKFHWDRRGKGHDTTCWIRTMQPWAGAGWGTQFIPRVGMEVVVGFEGGDIDKPLVLGCLYNGIHPPPFALPGDKTRSGIRTRSTPGAGGSNELSFQDAAGGEQVFVHAERDLDIEVGRNRTLQVGEDDATEISGNQQLEVRQEQRIDVDGGRWLTVTPLEKIEVRGERVVTVHGQRDETVMESDSLRVTGRRTEHFGGGLSRQLEGSSHEQVTGTQTLLVGTHDAPGSRSVHVEGSATLTTTAANVVGSDEEVVLRCGASFIRLSPERIEIGSPEVRVQGEGARLRLASDELRLYATSRVQGVAENIVMKSSGAALSLTSEAAVDGSRVLLNSPETADDPAEEDEQEPTVIELVDDEGNPIPNQPYRIELEDGTQVSGVLDSRGKAEIDLPAGGQIFFPGLSDVGSD